MSDLEKVDTSNKPILKFMFAGDNCHLALTHKLQGFSANNKPDPLIIKADEVVMTEEILKDFNSVNKTTAVNPAGKTTPEGVPTELVKTNKTTENSGEEMSELTQEQIEKAAKTEAALIEVQKQMADLIKANADRDATIASQAQELKKAKEEREQVVLKATVEVVKGLGFVASDEDQVNLATALIKVAAIDLEASKAIESALNKAKAAVEASVTTEKGGEGVDITADTLKSKVAAEIAAKYPKAKA